MRATNSLRKRKNLENAVRALCPIIENQICTDRVSNWTEYSLRRELVACILGSQVRHEMATISLECIEQAGLLDEKWWCEKNDTFELEILNVLLGKTPKGQKKWRYRFPNIRSHQLTEARNAVVKRSLNERISETVDVRQIRQSFIVDIAGLGPKQASMFLRNIGKSYELAILDTHVLRFMAMQNLLQIKHTYISGIRAYERVEHIIANYAKKLGFHVGFLDWAIWATMRAAWELGI